MRPLIIDLLQTLLPRRRAVKSARTGSSKPCHCLSASGLESLAMTDQVSFQFQCPSCGAVLQAALGNTLTSVQCGECSEVFDVQLPGRHAPTERSPGFRARADTALSAPFHDRPDPKP